jgi:AraC family transcriptional regulator of adaptative response/methylated-DNA-[protein]-cysteine methyltransferase
MNPALMKRPVDAAKLAAATLKDPRWKKLLAKDASADGEFYYSVRTTGVYCRVSCPSRIARPENVAFHATEEDARRAGFRPCRRCKPDLATTAAAPARRPDAINGDIRFVIGRCSLGSVLVAEGPGGICAILLGDDPNALANDLKERFPRTNLVSAHLDLEKQLAQIVGLIESPARVLPARRRATPTSRGGSARRRRCGRSLRRAPPMRSRLRSPVTAW